MTQQPGSATIGLCVNHPTVAAQTICASCGQPFCSSCLVTFTGQPHCGPCRDHKLAQMQGATAGAAPPARLAGTDTVDLGGWLTDGWNLMKDDLVTFGVATLLVLLIGYTSCGLLAGPMLCGLHLMFYRKMTYGRVEISNVFDGFQRFLNSMLVSLLLGLAYLVLVGGFYAALIASAFASQDNPLPFLGVYLLGLGGMTVLGLVMAPLMFFVFPHIAARNAGPIEAFSASWAVIRRNLVLFTVTAILYNLISGIGYYALCIGLFVTMPLIVAAQSKAYADHFGIEGFDRI